MTRRIELGIFATGVVLLTAYVAATVAMPKPDGRVVVGDATHYFVQLRSLVYDRDLDFHNEYVRLYGLDGYVPGTEWIYHDLTSTGRVRNYMPIGPALLWAPLYVLLSGLQLAASWVGLTRGPDGFDRLLQMTPGITGVAAATVAALASWRMARRWTDETTAAVAVFGIWLGSHALYYTLVSPTYSHAPSMLAVSLFFSSWTAPRARPCLVRFGIWGSLAGVAALMRWQDAVLLIVPLVEAVRWRAPMRQRLVACLAVGIAFIVVFAPQMVVWSVLYGQPLAIPQGPSFMQWTSPQLWPVLVSDNHGLFSWAPILVPAAIGLMIALRRQPSWRVPVAVVVLLSWYVNASVADWWGGEAFGARRFLSLFPLFVVGLAYWLDRSRVASRGWYVRVWVVVVLTGLNWLLLLQYQVFMKGLRDVAPYPEGAALWIDRFMVPFRLVERWLW